MASTADLLKLDRVHPNLPGEPNTWLVSERACTLGRARDNMVVLNEPTISRYHCLIYRAGDDFRLMNLSENPILAGGSDLIPVAFRENRIIDAAITRLQIANHLFTVSLRGGQASAEQTTSIGAPASSGPAGGAEAQAMAALLPDLRRALLRDSGVGLDDKALIRLLPLLLATLRGLVENLPPLLELRRGTRMAVGIEVTQIFAADTNPFKGMKTWDEWLLVLREAERRGPLPNTPYAAAETMQELARFVRRLVEAVHQTQGLAAKVLQDLDPDQIERDFNATHGGEGALSFLSRRNKFDAFRARFAELKGSLDFDTGLRQALDGGDG